MKALRPITVVAVGMGLFSAATVMADDVKLTQHKASNLLGANIQNHLNETVGEIEDIVISNTGQVNYAVVAHGGFIGIGEEYTAVPFNALHFGREQGLIGPYKEVTLNVTKEQMQSAPTFASDNYPDLNDQIWVTRVYRIYKLQPPASNGSAAQTDDAQSGEQAASQKSDKGDKSDKAAQESSSGVKSNGNEDKSKKQAEPKRQDKPQNSSSENQ